MTMGGQKTLVRDARENRSRWHDAKPGRDIAGLGAKQTQFGPFPASA